MSVQNYGVAPLMVATGDGAYAIPAGKTCIGYMATVAGTVAITSNGTNITPTANANQPYSAHITAFNSGGTATGVYAFLI